MKVGQEGISVFKVVGKQLYFNDELIGPSSALYLAHKPDFKGIRNEQARGIIRCTLPPIKAGFTTRFDIICCADNRVLGYESKRPGDLLNSYSNRRLSRQLSHLLSTTSVAGLIIRGQVPEVDRKGEWPRGLFKDLLRWQELGVRIIIGPENDDDLPEFIAELRPIMSGESVRGVLNYSVKKEYERGYLLRAIKGLGSQTSKVLLDKYVTVAAALNGSDKEWKELGVRNDVIKNRSEAMK